MDKEQVSPTIIEEVVVEPVRQTFSFELLGVNVWDYIVVFLTLWFLYVLTKSFYCHISNKVGSITNRRLPSWFKTEGEERSMIRTSVMLVVIVMLSYPFSRYLSDLSDFLLKIAAILGLVVLAKFLLRKNNEHFVTIARKRFGRGRATYTILRDGVRLVIMVFTFAAIIFTFRLSINDLFNLSVPGGVEAMSAILIIPVLNDLKGAVMLAFTHPISQGDYVEIGKWAGTFSDASLQRTILIGPSGETINIPNKTVGSETVINWKTRDGFRINWELNLDVKTVASCLARLADYIAWIVDEETSCERIRRFYEPGSIASHKLNLFYKIHSVDVEEVDTINNRIYEEVVRAIEDEESELLSYSFVIDSKRLKDEHSAAS